MSEWGTTFPADMGAITRAARVMESHGFDVHTITVMLDNGGWRVTILATDKDLEGVKAEFEVDTHGCAHPFDVKTVVADA